MWIFFNKYIGNIFEDLQQFVKKLANELCSLAMLKKKCLLCHESIKYMYGCGGLHAKFC